MRSTATTNGHTNFENRLVLICMDQPKQSKQKTEKSREQRIFCIVESIGRNDQFLSWQMSKSTKHIEYLHCWIAFKANWWLSIFFAGGFIHIQFKTLLVCIKRSSERFNLIERVEFKRQQHLMHFVVWSAFANRNNVTTITRGTPLSTTVESL